MEDRWLMLFFLLALALAGLLFSVVRRMLVFQQKISADTTLRQAGARTLHQLQQGGILLSVLAMALVIGAAGFYFFEKTNHERAHKDWKLLVRKSFQADAIWQAPAWSQLSYEPQARLIAYGRDLIAHTGDYFGPAGLVRPNSINALNCQNCHLEAGSKPFGNNYSAVAATYPKMRARSGQSEDIKFRINDCFQRSLNGQPLDTSSREMRAIEAYIRWLGTNVPPKAAPKGAGLVEVPFLDRAADPILGKQVYAEKCASCHGPDGQGLPMPDGSVRTYPPLWGEHSYAESAGLFRLSRFAGYAKANMPFGATWDNPQLSDAEAWDVAAFVNSQPRPPHRFLDRDWPDIAKKTFDHPFGPYADSFPEHQHKFGPFPPIVAFYKKK